MLRQFSKRSLISISSELSQIYLLIKVLYRPIWTLQTIFLAPRSECLFVLLAAVHLSNVLVLTSLDMKHFSFANFGMPV